MSTRSEYSSLKGTGICYCCFQIEPDDANKHRIDSKFCAHLPFYKAVFNLDHSPRGDALKEIIVATKTGGDISMYPRLNEFLDSPAGIIIKAFRLASMERNKHASVNVADRKDVEAEVARLSSQFLESSPSHSVSSPYPGKSVHSVHSLPSSPVKSEPSVVPSTPPHGNVPASNRVACIPPARIPPARNPASSVSSISSPDSRISAIESQMSNLTTMMQRLMEMNEARQCDEDDQDEDYMYV